MIWIPSRFSMHNGTRVQEKERAVMIKFKEKTIILFQ